MNIKKTVFVSMIVIISLSSLIVGYGVVTKYLKYHNTTFNDTSWFTVLQDVLINTTSGSMYLNGTAIEYEDFTSGWVESDASGRLSETITRITFTALDRADTSTYIYVNRAGEFQTFTKYFKFRLTQIQSSGSTIRFHPFIVTEHLGDFYTNQIGNYEQFGIQVRSDTSTTTYGLLLVKTINGVQTTASKGNAVLNVGTDYYVKIWKAGSTLYMTLYTDSLYTTEEPDYVGGLNLALDGNYNFPYLLLEQSYGGAPNVDAWGYTEYMTDSIAGGIEEKGYAYTNNLLENETTSAFSILINQTVGTGCNLKIYCSDDNITWNLQDTITSTGIYYNDVEDDNFTALYLKLEFTSNTINNIEIFDLCYTNLYEPGEDDLAITEIWWVCTLVYGFLFIGGQMNKTDSRTKIISYIFGILLGLLMLTENWMISISLIILNIVLLIYEAS